MQIRHTWILLMLFALSILAVSCGDSQITGGCPTYTHIVIDGISLGVEHDSISLFIYADEYYRAPISYVTHINEELVDSLGVVVFGYGQSSEREPKPYYDYVWHSDSLFLWFSGNPMKLDPITGSGRPIDSSQPCIPAYYYIDYITIWHTSDIVVDVDCTVRTIY